MYRVALESVAVQPPLGSIGGHAGPLGGGWKGVRLWCQQETAGAGWGALLNNFDLLVLQVDADISLESEPGHHPVPCPPPKDVVQAVRKLVLTWLGKTQMPPKTLLCIPAMASETWALVALFPDDPSGELRWTRRHGRVRRVSNRHQSHLSPARE
ncbi:MAG: hypothetical protein AB7S38_15105 [Vulcanimicrobiota bacterium]